MVSPSCHQKKKVQKVKEYDWPAGHSSECQYKTDTSLCQQGHATKVTRTLRIKCWRSD